MFRSLFGVHELFRSGVAENTVGDFVKRGLVRKLCNRANGYLALMREALHVAVDFIEWRAA